MRAIQALSLLLVAASTAGLATPASAPLKFQPDQKFLQGRTWLGPLDPSLQHCWTFLGFTKGCVNEILVSFFNNQMFMSPACCKAFNELSQTCVPRMFAVGSFDSYFPRMVKIRCIWNRERFIPMPSGAIQSLGIPPPATTIGGIQTPPPPPIGGIQTPSPPTIGGTRTPPPPTIGGSQTPPPPTIGGTQTPPPPTIVGTQTPPPPTTIGGIQTPPPPTNGGILTPPGGTPPPPAIGTIPPPPPPSQPIVKHPDKRVLRYSQLHTSQSLTEGEVGLHQELAPSSNGRDASPTDGGNWLELHDGWLPITEEGDAPI